MTTTLLRIGHSNVLRPVVGGRWRGRAGFSLIELLVVVMIIIIIMGVGVAVMNAVENNAKVSATRQTLKACTAIANEYLAQTGNVINHDQPIASNTFNYDWTTPKSYNRHLTRWLQPALWTVPTGWNTSIPTGTPYRKPPWAPFDAEVISDGPAWANASYNSTNGVYSWAWVVNTDTHTDPTNVAYHNKITMCCNAYKSIQRFVWAAMQNPVTNDMLMALGPQTLLEKDYWAQGPTYSYGQGATGAGFLSIVDAWGKPLEYRSFSNGGEKDGSGDIAPPSPYDPAQGGSPSYDPTQGATAPNFSTTVAYYNYWPALPACNTPFFASAGRDGNFGYHWQAGENNQSNDSSLYEFYSRTTQRTTAQMQTYQQDNLYSYEVK